MFESRGFPKDASAFAQLAYYVHIVSDQEVVARGLFRFVRAGEVAAIIADGGHYRYKSKGLVSHPDARRPSWLSTSEIQTALRTIGISNEPLGMNWRLGIRSMQAIEVEFQADVRLVFWFEN